MNVGLAFARNAARHPGDAAIFGERELTNRQLDQRSNRIANALLGAHRLAKGDRVALLTANRPEVVEVLGGIAKAGGCYVGLNFRLGPVELEQVFDNADPVLAITDTEHRHQLDGFDLPVIDIDRDLDAWAGAASPEPPDTLHQVRPGDDFCIVYTSGTTGRPKGVHF
ncbi:MAG: AMP-binding protein, partial [bacterium]|nr:AMP-binding protein [bacterium]